MNVKCDKIQTKKYVIKKVEDMVEDRKDQKVKNKKKRTRFNSVHFQISIYHHLHNAIQRNIVLLCE